MERLTDDARKAIILAQEEARGLRHDWVGSEHVLLGLLRHQDAFAARALASLGVKIEDVQEQVIEGVIEEKYKGENENRRTRAERRLRKDWRPPPPGTQRSENILELALRGPPVASGQDRPSAELVAQEKK